MAKDRAKDDRRSVGSHEKMMKALGRATGWETMAPTHPRWGGVIGRFDSPSPVSSSSSIAYTGHPHAREVKESDD